MSQQPVLPGLDRPVATYPGFLKPPTKVIESFPGGYLAAGSRYVQDLIDSAKAMRRARCDLWDAYRGHNGLNSWSPEWSRHGYRAEFVRRENSADGLEVIEWRRRDKDESRALIRLREDAVLTVAPEAAALLCCQSFYLWDQLISQMGNLSWSIWTITRGMALTDPVVRGSDARFSLTRLRAKAKYFCRQSAKRTSRIRGGNNLYDFADLIADRHPELPNRSALFFTLKKPVRLCDDLLGAMVPGAIIAEIRDDGVLCLGSGMSMPIEGLGTRGRDSGADMEFSPDYSWQPLFELWLSMAEAVLD